MEEKDQMWARIVALETKLKTLTAKLKDHGIHPEEETAPEAAAEPAT